MALLTAICLTKMRIIVYNCGMALLAAICLAIICIIIYNCGMALRAAICPAKMCIIKHNFGRAGSLLFLYIRTKAPFLVLIITVHFCMILLRLIDVCMWNLCILFCFAACVWSEN